MVAVASKVGISFRGRVPKRVRQQAPVDPLVLAPPTGGAARSPIGLVS